MQRTARQQFRPRLAAVAAAAILAIVPTACGGDDDDGGSGGDSGDSEASSAEAAPIESAAECLEAAGFGTFIDDAPEGVPYVARLDGIGEAGGGSASYYASVDEASESAEGMSDTFGDDEGTTTGQIGVVSWFYNNSPDEADTMAGCLTAES